MPASSANKKKHVAIIGAGVIGLSCALWLQKKGFKVSLVDPSPPGSGTSSGNACVIADYGCIPINSPSVFKDLPHLLFSKDSPLALNPLYVARHLPWSLRFLAHCRPTKVAHIKNQLAQFLTKTYDGLNPLLELSNTKHLLRQDGMMHLFKTKQEFEAVKADREFRAQQGINSIYINSDEIRELEPNLKMPFECGLLTKAARRVLNPQTLSNTYFDCFTQQGGKYIKLRTKQVQANEDGVTLHLNNGELFSADKLVVAAGAFSTQIDGTGIAHLPLDTERGYHLQYNGLQHLLNRPVTWNRRGFYLSPMDKGLRVAGSVEIAGYSEQKNQRRLNYLQRISSQMLDLPSQPDQEWLGFRPTMPDSLPIIGHSPRSTHIVLAFGHHHLGLTLAGITGKLVAELLNNEPLCHDISAFSPQRFD